MPGFPARRISKRSDNKTFNIMYVVLLRTTSVNQLESEKETSFEIKTAKSQNREVIFFGHWVLERKAGTWLVSTSLFILSNENVGTVSSSSKEMNQTVSANEYLQIQFLSYI